MTCSKQCKHTVKPKSAWRKRFEKRIAEFCAKIKNRFYGIPPLEDNLVQKTKNAVRRKNFNAHGQKNNSD